MPLYQICIYTVSAVSVDNIDLSYTSANYRAQQGQQSFGKYQATLSSNGKFAQSLCISTAILKFATISEPKAAFLKDTKNLFWGNEIVSNLKESFTTNKKKKFKKWPSTSSQSTQPPAHCRVNIPQKTQEHMNSLPHAQSEFIVTTLRVSDILTMLHWLLSESKSTLSNREKTEKSWQRNMSWRTAL